MIEMKVETYKDLNSLYDHYSNKPFGFRERFIWNGGQYLVFVREDKDGDFGTEIVFRKLLTE